MCAYHHFAETAAGADHRCPVCRAELGANPLDALLQDGALQTVVDTLFPHFAADEAALAAAADPAPAAGPASPALDPRKIVHGAHYSDRVAFVLVPRPGSDSDSDRAGTRLPKPYVATTGRATVRHVAQYIVHALHAAHGTRVRPEQVVVSFRGQVFGPDNTLNHIFEVHHLGHDAPLLCYEIRQ